MNQTCKKHDSVLERGIAKAVKIDGRWLITNGAIKPETSPRRALVNDDDNDESTDRGYDYWMACTMVTGGDSPASCSDLFYEK